MRERSRGNRETKRGREGEGEKRGRERGRQRDETDRWRGEEIERMRQHVH